MGTLQERVYDIRGEVIPRLEAIRRVPVRYQRILPLWIMKRYRCAVIGGAPGALTLAVTDRESVWILETLRELTGCVIFVVLVDAGKMDLLIRRVERANHYRYSRLRPLSPYHPLRVRSMVTFSPLLPALRKRQ
jgi:hypothetical protein